jgi:hypothetical protein
MAGRDHPVRAAFRRAPREAAGWNYHHIRAFRAIPEYLARFVSVIRRMIRTMSSPKGDLLRAIELNRTTAADFVRYDGLRHHSDLTAALETSGH